MLEEQCIYINTNPFVQGDVLKFHQKFVWKWVLHPRKLKGGSAAIVHHMRLMLEKEGEE